MKSVKRESGPKWIKNPGGSCRSIDCSVTSRGLILQRPCRSCLVLSCTMLQMGPWHPCRRVAETVWRHRRQQQRRKSSLLTLCCRGGVFWSESLVVSKASQSPGCEPWAERSSQNIHSSAPMYPHAQTDTLSWQITALTLDTLNSQPRSRSSCSVLWKKKILDAAFINIHTSPDKKAGSVGIPLGRVDRCVSSLRCPITQLIW